ncbi:MAG: threonine aldolase [Rickettsiales bacterium]|nr:MAG: threonine aldolase [Rickettsiales bacterium]
MNKPINLRSDTTTPQTQNIIDAMTSTPVEDAAYGEDMATNELSEYCKELFQVEDAVFLTGGMLANRLAIASQTSPGDEVITHHNYHINFFDSAGNAKINNVVLNCNHNPTGVLSAHDVEEAINSKPRYHMCSQVKLITIENSINGFNGKIYPFGKQVELYKYTKDRDINLHLDGARIFNAHIETKIPLAEYAKHTDTMSFCFAKGLGAPFGSMLLGRKEVIEKVRIMQIWLGSGYHQIGYYANAAKYALQNNIPRLSDDNKNTKILADKIKSLPHIKLILPYPETNILTFSIKELGVSNDIFLDECKKLGLLLFPWLEGQIRAVVHLAVSHSDIKQAAKIIETVILDTLPLTKVRG